MIPHILVVEDEDSLATLLQYNLQKEGYDVALAGDAGAVAVDRDGRDGRVHSRGAERQRRDECKVRERHATSGWA